MRVLMISAEVAPYAKTGGLGEVMSALPKAVHRLGHDVRVYTPLYGLIDQYKFAFVPVGKKSAVKFGRKSFAVNFHASILSQEIPIYFLENQDCFGQYRKLYPLEPGNLPFALLNYGVFKLLDQLDWVPDVIHCHDWHSGLIPNLINELPSTSKYSKVSTVFTIHNAGFVSLVSQWDVPIEKQDKGIGPLPQNLQGFQYLNFLRRGVAHADIVTTVSERHAVELLGGEEHHDLGKMLRKRKKTFFGIRNGVDYKIFNPLNDANLPVNYDVNILHRKYDNKRALQHRMGLEIDDSIPLLGMNTRITEQKGFSLLKEIFDDLMKLGVQVVVVGSGSPSYEEFLRQKMEQYPKQVAHRSYSPDKHSQNWPEGSLVYAGADIFLMPSLYEPSGLGQMISLRYGTIPVVRKTGGLADTISEYREKKAGNGGNGFVFDSFSGVALMQAIKRALAVYEDKERWWKLMKRGMSLSYSWEVPAKKYVRMYEAAMKEKNSQPWSIPKKW